MTENIDVKLVEEVERMAMRAWPGLEIEVVDGWLLRHAVGVTRRANSVWPNQAAETNPVEKNLAYVESFYHERSLPARFQICPAAQPAGLDELLAERGYRAVATTAVQITRVEDMLGKLEPVPKLSVQLSATPSASWWQCYATADEVASEALATRQAICAQIKPATAYAAVMRNGEVVAVGSAVAEAGWVGYFNVATLPEHRRIGAASALMRALGEWGREMGASKTYLQVMTNNEAALRLYARLDFETLYHYHYREEVRSRA